MSTTTSVTATQLLTFHANDRCELVAGKLRMMSPAGWKHGRIVQNLAILLGGYANRQGIGVTFGAEAGFFIARDPDTVRAPDLAFIARQNLPGVEPAEAYWPGAPDLAVEVLSPDGGHRVVLDKTRAWLDAGAKQVWLLDPKTRTVTVYRSLDDTTVYAIDHELDGGDVVVGFRCRVADIFASTGGI